MTYFFDDWVIQIEEFDAAIRPGVALRGHTLEDVDAAIRSYEAPFVKRRDEEIAAAKAADYENRLVGPAGRRRTSHHHL